MFLHGFDNLVIPDLALHLCRLRTTLVLQFKPHYIAAGSLSLAARFHNVRLPSEKGKVWWQQFDIAPKLLEGTV
jgi:cyclin T